MTIETTEKESLLNSTIAFEWQGNIMKHSQFEMENLSCPVVVKNTQSYTAWVSEYKTRQFKNFKFV